MNTLRVVKVLHEPPRVWWSLYETRGASPQSPTWSWWSPLRGTDPDLSTS
jgi:hypothetical protein